MVQLPSKFSSNVHITVLGTFLSSARAIRASQRFGTIAARQRLRHHPPATTAAEAAELVLVETTMNVYFSEDAQINYKMATQTLEDTLKELKNKSMLTTPNITVALHSILSKHMWDPWLKMSIWEALRADLPKMLLGKGSMLAAVASVCWFHQCTTLFLTLL